MDSRNSNPTLRVSARKVISSSLREFQHGAFACPKKTPALQASFLKGIKVTQEHPIKTKRFLSYLILTYADFSLQIQDKYRHFR